MARKLIAVAALVALMSLASAGAALAVEYDLGAQGDTSNWTWRHNYSGKNPWDEGTEFLAGTPTFYSYEDIAWKIGYTPETGTWLPITNSAAGTHTDPDPITKKGTYTVIFNNSGANPIFFFDGSKFDDVPDIIISTNVDVSVTYTVNYQYSSVYTVDQGTFKVTGKNGTVPFEFIATGLIDTTGNHVNQGYITSATLVYPSAVPLPAGVWLLGTGLLGLACLGRRRRK
jgi:hypothetical protein